MSPFTAPEVGESTSNHSVHLHLGWQCVVVLWVVVSLDLVTGSMYDIGVLVGSSFMLVVNSWLVGRGVEETVPAVLVGIVVQIPADEVCFVVKAGVDCNVSGEIVSVVWMEETPPGLLVPLALETCGELLPGDVTRVVLWLEPVRLVERPVATVVEAKWVLVTDRLVFG